MAGKKPIAPEVIEKLNSKYQICISAGKEYLLAANNQAIEIDSPQWKDFVSLFVFLELGKCISETNLKEVAKIQRMQARQAGNQKTVYVRSAAPDNKHTYIDINDKNGTVYEITPSGFRVTENSDVLFLRPPHSLPLCEPDPKGSVEHFFQYFNVSKNKLRKLIFAYACYCVRGRVSGKGSYPGAAAIGAPGSAKTTFVKLLKHLIDPGKPEVRSPTKDVRVLFIAAKNCYLLTLDNVSHLDPEIQDALCSILTGGGYGAKTNYTDDSETVIEICIPIVLNGINFVIRPDLQNRLIIIELDPIKEEDRLTENEVWENAEKLRPLALGAIFDALSKTLAVIDDIDPREIMLPRLADFGLFTVALERAMKWPEGEILLLMKENADDGYSQIAESNKLITQIIKFISDIPSGKWDGTATDLLTELNRITPESDRRHYWPGDGGTLGSALTRHNDTLKAYGISIEKRRNGQERRLYITKIQSKPDEQGSLVVNM